MKGLRLNIFWKYVPGFKRKYNSLQQLKICDQLTHSKTSSMLLFLILNSFIVHLLLQLFISFCYFGLFGLFLQCIPLPLMMSSGL
jgi:hypothetical protein